jgi:hypothetical protein
MPLQYLLLLAPRLVAAPRRQQSRPGLPCGTLMIDQR